MTGVDVLRFQLLGSCDQVAAHARDAADLWTTRAFAGSSLPGFIAWHCARMIDWGVHTVVREIPEVASGAAWQDRVRYNLGHGAGLSDGEADEVAATVQPDDVAAYAAALRMTIDEWTSVVTDADLDMVPALRTANEHHPRYATTAAWAEIEGLDGLPAWQLLVRPCVLHVRVHMGEIETLGVATRARMAEGG
jgi:hypothetical protein